jgi:hypothetical protein
MVIDFTLEVPAGPALPVIAAPNGFAHLRRDPGASRAGHRADRVDLPEHQAAGTPLSGGRPAGGLAAAEAFGRRQGPAGAPRSFAPGPSARPALGPWVTWVGEIVPEDDVVRRHRASRCSSPTFEAGRWVRRNAYRWDLDVVGSVDCAVATDSEADRTVPKGGGCRFGWTVTLAQLRPVVQPLAAERAAALA